MSCADHPCEKKIREVQSSFVFGPVGFSGRIVSVFCLLVVVLLEFVSPKVTWAVPWSGCDQSVRSTLSPLCSAEHVPAIAVFVRETLTVQIDMTRRATASQLMGLQCRSCNPDKISAVVKPTGSAMADAGLKGNFKFLAGFLWRGEARSGCLSSEHGHMTAIVWESQTF